jgi:ubiquinone/menaquinone biosynthesis C-methylase UbiE
VRATFQVAVAEALSFPDRRFDVVFSTLMLHLLPRKTRQECAKEIERVLKVGGRVVAVDFGRTERRGLLAHFHSVLAHLGVLAAGVGPFLACRRRLTNRGK